MTTNHPAHGHVSLDRLHQIREILSKASAQSDGGNLGYAMADAVKVIDEVQAAHARKIIRQRKRSVGRSNKLGGRRRAEVLAALICEMNFWALVCRSNRKNSIQDEG